MKQFITFLALIFSYMLCGAQATTLAVDNQTPGWLSSKISYSDQQSVENITITGYINGTDIDFIRTLNGDRNLRGVIDLKDVSIVKGGTLAKYPYTIEKDNELPYECFSDMKSLRKFVYPKTATATGWCLVHTPCDTVIITNTDIKELRLRDYVYPTDKARTKFTYIPDGVESLPDLPEDAYNMGLRFPSSIKTITVYGGMRNARIFAEMLNPEIIVSEYEVYTGTSSGGRYTKYPAVEKSIIYVPKGLLARYKESALKNNQIIEYYDLDGLSYQNTLDLFVDDIKPLEIQAIPNANFLSYYIFQASNSDVASVDESGVVTAKKYGKCSIDISTQMVSPYSLGTTGICNINVYAHVCGISIEKSVVIGKNDTKKLNCELLPLNETNGKVAWTSDDNNVATVDENGVVSGISIGNCKITVSSMDGGYTAQCDVSVVQPVESITVSPKSLTIKVGETATTSANILPLNAIDKTISWHSESDLIAGVNNDGLITGISAGEVKIFATSNYNPKISDYCVVTILQPVTGIMLDRSEVEIIEDESKQLIATVLPENATNKSVNWTSSDISVAMVSLDGTVYALKAGQATIMATTVDGGLVALCKVTVKAKTIQTSNIELSSNSESIAVGETLQLNAIISPDNASNKTLNWTSTNPSIASVNASGLVTAIAEGKTQIIATTTDGSNLSAICEITVNKQFISVSKIRITPSTARITVGQTLNLSAAIAPDDATNKAVKWSSTNPAIATVSESGAVSAISEGDVIIIASTQDGSNLSATCQVEVYTETIFVETINLNPTKIEGAVNDTYEIAATVLPTNATNKSINWKSSDVSIVTVDDGAITLHALGTAIITAEAMDGSNVKSECYIIVSHEAGIDSIIADKESYVKVFNISGYLIYEGIYSEAKLAPGFYIVLCNGASYKTKVD